MAQGLLTGKAESTQVEFLRSLPVAGMTSVIDFGLLIFLTEYLHVHYLTSAAISFLVGHLWLYIMSVNWIFATRSIDDHVSGFTKFLLISLAGLGLTLVSLWLLTEVVHFYYLLSKVVVSAVVFQILFQVRKKFLFS